MMVVISAFRMLRQENYLEFKATWATVRIPGLPEADKDPVSTPTNRNKILE